MIYYGFSFTPSSGFWNRITPELKDGSAGIWAVPWFGPDGALNFAGVTQPEWKRCRAYINETNCLVSGEDDETVQKVKEIMEKYNRDIVAVR